MRRGIRIGATVVAMSIVAAGCGGDERQDEDEPEGSYAVEIVEATFPETQSLAAREELKITVRNADTKRVPVLAVTVDSFAKDSEQPGLADPSRPVWVVDEAPEGGTTAYTNTWALGSLEPGRTKTFRWRVTPVQAGRHTVDFRVAAGLDGKAKATLAGGGTPEGSFTVNISDEPSQARVDPSTGDVVRDADAD